MYKLTFMTFERFGARVMRITAYCTMVTVTEHFVCAYARAIVLVLMCNGLIRRPFDHSQQITISVYGEKDREKISDNKCVCVFFLAINDK